MKKRSLIFNLIVIAIFSLMFLSCEKEKDLNVSVSDSKEFESISLAVKSNFFQNTGRTLKSATISTVDSVYIYLYYQNGLAWELLEADDFAPGSDANLSLENPIKVEYSEIIAIPYAARSASKFLFQGFDLAGNKSFKTQTEVDLRDESDGWQIVANFVETKCYQGMDVSEILTSQDSFVFDYSYILYEIDDNATLENLGTIDGNSFPVFSFQTPGNSISGQLVIFDGVATLDNNVVDASSYIDIAEYWNACAPEGFNWELNVYRNGTILKSVSISEDWLNFGVNNYVELLNSTSGSATFTFLHNGKEYSDWDINKYLVAYYPFNGDASDESGNSNDGVVSGATLTVDRFGNANSAYLFDGDNDYIVVANSESFNIPKEISISFWIKLETSAPYYFPYAIIHKYGSWGIGQRGWDINFSIVGSDEADYGDWATSFSADTYYNLIMIFNGSTLNLYVDGILMNSVPFGGDINLSTSDLFFGRNYLSGDYYFDGTLDDFRIYNYAISENEISELSSDR